MVPHNLPRPLGCAHARHGVGAVDTKSTAQGASTQVWAATDPALRGHGGLYLEDCAEAVPAGEATRYVGVQPYAVDPTAAHGLWRWCEDELELSAPS